MITHTAINFGRGAQTIGNFHRWPTMEICAERAVHANTNANTHIHTHTQQQAIQRGPSTGFIRADINQQPKTLGSGQGVLQTRGFVHREHQEASVNNKDLHTEGANQGFLCAGSFCVWDLLCSDLLCSGPRLCRILLCAWPSLCSFSVLGPPCANIFTFRRSLRRFLPVWGVQRGI